MKQFPKALQAALDELEWTQTTLAEKSGIPFPQLNRYVRGGIKAGPDIREKICKALPEAQRAQVICAYLQDEIPESGIDLVKITAFAGKAAKAPRMPANLPEGVREALESLARKSIKHPGVGELVVLLNDLVHGDK